jgi:hypothetical protein
MRSLDYPVDIIDGKHVITCIGCNNRVYYASKAGAINALNRKACSGCSVNYQAKAVLKDTIYQNADKKWCSVCPSCNVEQAYTRMDHARSSHLGCWRCKKCSAESKAFSSELMGFYNNIRLSWFKRFRKSAQDRNLYWELTIEQVDSLWVDQEGKCALSGVLLDNAAGTQTVSLDRIDSTKGYTFDNVQLVHKVLNMMKRNMTDENFIDWCSIVANYNNQKV